VSGLSVIIITFNEEKNIRDCLQSVAWADEIVVVDSKSTDRTVEIAREFTGKIIITDWMGYSETKKLALEQATCAWVLWIDADERVTDELRLEIQSTIKANPPQNGFEVSRRAFFLGKWIKHCGWYPGYVLRLFRKNKARFDDSPVHEGVILAGERGRLKGDLLHFTDDTLEHYLEKLNNYTSLAAHKLISQNRQAGIFVIFSRALFIFVKMYVLRFGFLDGIKGFILCLLSANYVAVKYAKLWELHFLPKQ
jgi:glycosyltransferase involved in cell wall biosynthesis